MEKESFEDEEIAKILNDDYVSIKVDREERPDIDSVYMNVCQVINGHGGWPLSIFLTPDKKPFFAGTYFPKHNRYGTIGFMDLLNKISNLWSNNKEELVSKGDDIVTYLQPNKKDKQEDVIEKDSIKKSYMELKNDFDKINGGFSNAPKFPTPHNLLFLMRYYKYYNEEDALEMCLKTLKSMYKGGIYDHIGGGFSRYSTDEKWLVPHFEKMLYDNALLIFAYTDAYLITKEKFYKEVAMSIIEYISRDMTNTEGGFYSAEDADSEGIEGKFYVWSYDEIINVLGEEEGKLFINYYGISKDGNFEGFNIPNLINTDIYNIENNIELKNKMKKIKKKLFMHREKRVHPHKDDKILTAWNGLMIAALAYAGKCFAEEKYVDMAIKATDFIMNYLVNEDGRLYVRYREQEASNEGFLDDYAYFTWGLIELYEATFNANYLEKAVKLNNDMINLFWDKEVGGFFLYGNDSEQLIIRPKEIYDGALPSGNSVAALNILLLSRITGDYKLDDKVNSIFRTFSEKVNIAPRYYAFLMISVLYSIEKTKDIVISAEPNNEDMKKLVQKMNSNFDSYLSLVINNGDDRLLKLNKELISKRKVNDNITVYICEDFSCKEPITDLNIVLQEIIDN
jgi:uncharacterized protein YyaL (SSP411 family)